MDMLTEREVKLPEDVVRDDEPQADLQDARSQGAGRSHDS
jgi:hypothetical protein